MKRLLFAVAVLAGAILLWSARPGRNVQEASPGASQSDWALLDPQTRCARATELVTYGQRWPTLCRWREPGEGVTGQSFPPPPGPPPYDDPHVEIYLAKTQTLTDVARTIAHEFGHMHHTREFARLPEWLAARGLSPQTPSEVWTEDYAEVFAALFGPPDQRWRAPTTRPSPEALAALRSQFFS